METPSKTQSSKNKKRSASKAGKGTVEKPASLFNYLSYAPLVLFFFAVGMYVGSQVGVTKANGSLRGGVQRLGLPGTNNIHDKWEQQHVPENEAGAVARNYGESMNNNVLNGSPPAQPVVAVAAAAAMSTSTSSSSSRGSFHATQSSFVVAPSHLDDSNILISAWIYLDTSSVGTMRTIFSNKGPGCEAANTQNGLAVYVNGWETNDRKLYVEYGGPQSGCNKLFSGSTVVENRRWTHIAVMAGQTFTALYKDGEVVGSMKHDHKESHTPQDSLSMMIGRYARTGDSAYPLFGNISGVVIGHAPAAEASDELKMLQYVHLLQDLTSDIAALPSKVNSFPSWVKAVYALNDGFPKTQAEVDGDAIVQACNLAATSKGDLSAEYVLPSGKGSSIDGVKIPLINGLVGAAAVAGNNPPVSEERRKQSDDLARSRREKVKEGMQHAWSGYKKYAWGKDEVKPLSNRGQDNWGGLGVTLVDSLDTLWVMNMKDEFYEAVDWVKNSLSFDHTGDVSTFETTIRELGGLLAAYDLSGEKVLLDKSKDLGERLLKAFNTKSGVPSGRVNLKSGSGGGGWSGGAAVLSELGTLQVEFRNLAYATKDLHFETKSMKVMQLMNRHRSPTGLYPIKISQADGRFADSQITFGALGDSFYEYLLKLWVQGGRKETWLREMYDQSMDGMIDKLLLASDPGGLAFVSDFNGRSNVRKMDHLVCFLPGILALGAYTDPSGLESSRAVRDLAVAKALMYTCYEMYHQQSTGISPEYVEFPKGRDMVVGGTAPFYILRPETVESLFVLNQLTGDPTYREWGWNIWQSIDKHCRTPTAYGALPNVNQHDNRIDDRMESFFLGETMKYLYLLQDPDNTIDLMKYVFNTEAHPTRIFDDSHIPIQG